MKKTYLCGAITKIGVEQAATNFERMEKLIPKGYEVVNPMKLPHNHDKSWSSYMRECICELVKCDAIVIDSNWRESKGAMLEREIAIQLGLKRFYL
jgi:hypothetical protein